MQDRIAALGLTEYEDGLCSGCGQPMHLTMDPDNERRWVADLPFRCHACTVRETKAHEYDHAAAPGALRYPVRLKPPKRATGASEPRTPSPT